MEKVNLQKLLIKGAFLIMVTTIISCSTSSQESNQNSEQQSAKNFQVKTEYTYADIRDFDSSEFRIKRNEIFAQYGYIFKSPELNNYFRKFDWYTAKTDNVDSLLKELDIKNIKFLKEYERIFKYRRKAKEFLIDNSATNYPLSEFPSIFKLKNNHKLLMDSELMFELEDSYLGNYLYPNINELRQAENATDADERYPLQVLITRPIQLINNNYLFSTVSVHHGASYTDYMVFFSVKPNAQVIDTIRLDPFKYRDSNLFLIGEGETTKLNIETNDEVLEIKLDSTGHFERL